jgi:hypothetical protein
MARVPFGTAPEQGVSCTISYGVVFALEECAKVYGISRTRVQAMALASFVGRRGFMEPPTPALPWIYDNGADAYMADLGNGRAVIVEDTCDHRYAHARIHLLELGSADVVFNVDERMDAAGYIATVNAVRRWPDIREAFPPAPIPGIEYNLGASVPRTLKGWQESLDLVLRKAA